MKFKLKSNSPPRQFSQEDFKKSLWVLLGMLGLTFSSWITTELLPQIDSSTPEGFSIATVAVTVSVIVKRYMSDYSKN